MVTPKAPPPPIQGETNEDYLARIGAFNTNQPAPQVQPPASPPPTSNASLPRRLGRLARPLAARMPDSEPGATSDTARADHLFASGCVLFFATLVMTISAYDTYRPSPFLVAPIPVIFLLGLGLVAHRLCGRIWRAAHPAVQVTLLVLGFFALALYALIWAGFILADRHP